MIVIVPMAGDDSAFREQGHAYCKSLIEVRGKPLVQHVYENLRSLPADRFVFLVRKDDVQRHHLGDVIRLLDPQAAVVQIEEPTGGAACSVLLAIEHIAPAEELVVTNGDQLILTHLGSVVGQMRERGLDGGTIVFDSVHPRWSFVLIDEEGLVIEAAEKRPVSRLATAGFYYFRKGGDFLEAACGMIRKDAHVNGQFYVCPVFNEMILRHAGIGVARIERDAYVSLATPQNVEEFEQRPCVPAQQRREAP
jgi:dTDP-glucose pyrophosphorylase